MNYPELESIKLHKYLILKFAIISKDIMHQQMKRMLLGASKIPRKYVYSLSKKQGNLRFLWVFQDELLKKTL